MASTRPPADTTLYLVRHGATDANQQRPYVLQGRGIDLPLSDLGRKQAAAVGQFLSRIEVHRVFSSPMLRAVQTARNIADHHDVDVTLREELIECDVGQWEGMNWESIMRAHPEAYRAFMDDPAENPYRGGESYSDVLRRVQPAIAQLLQQHAGESIVVVAHNVVNRAYLASLLGLELGRAKDLNQSNAGVNVIRDRNGKTSLLTLNAHFHLDGL